MAPVLIFTSVYVAAMWSYGVLVESPLANIYGPVTVVLIGLLVVIQRSAHFRTPVLWALSAVGLGNMAGGVVLVNGNPLYLAPVIAAVRYDKFFHVAATGVAAWAAWEALKRWAAVQLLTPALAFTVVMMAAGAGALVEIVEFSSTLLFPTTSVGDYGNNMLDLVANLSGAISATALLACSARLHPRQGSARS